MAYKMKGFSYPGTSPLAQLADANKKANSKQTPFRKGVSDGKDAAEAEMNAVKSEAASDGGSSGGGHTHGGSSANASGARGVVGNLGDKNNFRKGQ